MIDNLLNVYLPRLFEWVIETSIMASLLVGLIICVKLLLRNKLTPRWHYLLWVILIVRLILPWSPGSSYSIYSILLNSYESIASEQSQSIGSLEKEQLHEAYYLSDLKIVTDQEPFDTYTPPTIEESKKETLASNDKQEEEPLSIHSIAVYIWLAGMIVLGFTTYLANNRLQHYIKQQPAITDKKIINIFENCKKLMSIQQNIPLHLAGKISSPTVLGFFRPRILLSSVQTPNLNEQQLRHIFHHELAHIKRRDVGMNWLMHGLLILNWFNPILWYAYFCMREDQELACDAYALTFMEEEEKIPYGHTIISLLEHYSKSYQVPSLANLSRNKRTLKRRIFMIKKFQKKSYGWSVLGIVTVIAISTLSLLNADASTEKQEEPTETKESATEEMKSNGFDPSLNKFIAEHAEEFKNTTDFNEYAAKFDKLLSEFANQYTGYPTVEAAYDFENLRTLIHWGAGINFSYSGFQEDNETDEIVARAKRVPEYTKQLLHDLDVVMNKNGKGETFGVLHQMNGEHVKELEEFAYDGQGFPAERKEYNMENYQITEVESGRFDPSLKKFIAKQAEKFKNTSDDVNEYSAKIEQFDQEIGKHFRFTYTLEVAYDFENLRALTSKGSHFIYVIGQQKQLGIVDPAESIDELNQTFEYMKQLLNDLDIVMNKNGKGETFGLLYQLNGDHIMELEKFIWGEQGFPTNLKDSYTQRIQKK